MPIYSARLGDMFVVGVRRPLLAEIAILRRRPEAAFRVRRLGYLAKAAVPPCGLADPRSTGMSDRPRGELDLSLLGDLQRVIHFNAEVPNCRLELGMAEQQLNSAEVLGASID